MQLEYLAGQAQPTPYGWIFKGCSVLYVKYQLHVYGLKQHNKHAENVSMILLS